MLLDEPFSSLDWQTRQRIWQNVKSLLKAFNLTTLLVTHEPKEADFLADRQIHLHLGTINLRTNYDLFFRQRTR